MCHVAGREILPGPRWPLGTAAYKAEPKSLLARQEVRGAHSTVWIAWETRREGRSLLQSVVLKGVWDVRLPHGYQRSRQRPETAESPISHVQAGQAEKVLESV